MLKAHLNSETLEILCPLCKETNFEIFRRDKLTSQNPWCENESLKGQYLNHCKCDNCSQLFVYNVDKMNNMID